MSVAPTANASSPATPCAAQTRERGRRIGVDAELEHLVAERGEQVGRPVERDDPPGVHDADAVAEPLGLVEVVRREQHGRAEASAQAADDVDELVADARIEPDGRFVEEQHAWFGDERACDLEPPALPAAVGRDRTVEQVGEVEAVGELRRCAGRRRRRATPQSRAWISKLRRPVRARSTTGSWNTTALSARAAIASVATSRPCKRAEPDVGRTVVVSMPTVVDLPGAVRPEQSEDLAGGHVEVDALHRLDAARPRSW